MQLKFYLELEVETSTGTTDTRVKQLIWSYDPISIAAEFPGDWSRLAEHPLVRSRVSREPVSGKGRFQSLDLRNVKTLYPAYGQDRGSLVATYKKDNDLGLSWPAALSEAEADGLVSKDVAARLLELFEAFQTKLCRRDRGFCRKRPRVRSTFQAGGRLRRLVACDLYAEPRETGIVLVF